MREINVEQLIGKKVVDSDGQKVGTIHEISVERGEESCPVEAYYVGKRALLVRVAQWAVPSKASSFLQSKMLNPYRIAWDEMDLSDPEHPRTTVNKEQLRTSRPRT
jgi:sporulation protein YlmC with PRC-barrel domain